MIVIVDYGMGNLSSIKNMAKYLGYECIISSLQRDIEEATKLILPGVGNFGAAMHQLQQQELISILNKKVIDEKTPVLGICLGMQLLTNYSEEGDCRGLGWIDAEVKKFSFSPEQQLKVPHMGWDYIQINHSNRLVEDVEDDSRYYFVHSYAVQCNNDQQSVAKTEYGYKFDSIIQRDNIVGTQFHPEKSHKYGMKILRNYLEKY